LDSEAVTDHTLDLKSDPARHMTRKIPIKGYRVAKDGKRLVPCLKHLDVSTHLKRQGSKRVRPAKSRVVTLNS
jgi:hypothetical protein